MQEIGRVTFPASLQDLAVFLSLHVTYGIRCVLASL